MSDTDSKEIILRGEYSAFAADLRHDSILVCEVPHRLSAEGLKKLGEHLATLFPSHRRLILDSGMKLHIVHPAEAPEDDGSDG